MKRIICALAISILGIGSAQANDRYLAEIIGSYSETDPDAPGVDSFSEKAISGIIHFQPVSTDKLPLAEASFLNSASNIAAAYSENDDSVSSEFKALRGEFYIGQFFLSPQYVKADFDYPAPFPDTGFDVYQLRAGAMIVKGLRVAVGYTRNDDADVDAVSVDAKYVLLLGGGGAWNFEGTISNYDDGADTQVVDLATDFYPFSALSFGITAEVIQNDIADGSEIGLRAKWFPAPNLSLSLSDTIAYDDDDEEIASTLRGTIGVRF